MEPSIRLNCFTNDLISWTQLACHCPKIRY